MIIIADGKGVEECLPGGKAVHVYVPHNFDAQAILRCGPKQADAANWFIDRLYLYSHFGMRQDRFGFTPLKVSYLRRVIPQTFERELRKRLEYAGVIGCDYCYIEGLKSYGYRLMPKYQTKHKRIPIRHPLIGKNIERLRKGLLQTLSKVHRHLFKQFERLTIDLTDVHVDAHVNDVWANFNEMTLDLLRNKEWTPNVCQYGRFHTPLTRLLSDYRKGLRLDGQRVINLDLANSQPLFLSVLFLKVLSKQINNQFIDEQKDLRTCLLNSENVSSLSVPFPIGPYTMGEVIKDDVREYIQLTQKGQLYEYLSTNSSLSRKEFKEKLFKDVFYGKNRVRTKLMEDFERLFPNVFAFIRKVKRTNYERLAWVMQKEESRLMIDLVCGRLMKEHPDVPILTIHDSIMTTPAKEDVVTDVIRAEFAKLGLSPTIRVERY